MMTLNEGGKIGVFHFTSQLSRAILSLLTKAIMPTLSRDMQGEKNAKFLPISSQLLSGFLDVESGVIV